MPDTIDAILMHLETSMRQAVGLTMEKYLDERVADLHERLDNAYPPSSKPGESPHRRTGSLYEGIGTVLVDESDAWYGTVWSTRGNGDPMVPAYLEFGTGIHASVANYITSGEYVKSGQGMAPRPFMGPAVDEIKETGLERIATILKETLKP